MYRMRDFILNYWKEILTGITPVVFLFFLYMDLNIFPLVIMAVLVFVIIYMMRSKSMAGAAAGTNADRTKKPELLTFEDIGGQERAKNELREALDFMIKQEEIQKLGIRPLKGILLTGPPGTGKTLMAKAAAHYTGSAFVSASGSEFVEMYVGVGASRIRELFKAARDAAKQDNKDSAVIFIDEIDVVGSKRDGGQHREYDQTLNQLLTEMDGMHTSQTPRILLVAATNRKEMLDSALTRPGRFDRHIEVDLPDKKGRLHILRLHAKNKPLSSEANLEHVAAECFGFSGAQLESVMNEAAIYAMREEETEISSAHLSMAIDKVMMGERTDRESTHEERKRVAIHELGHAIAAEALRPGSVSQISLRPRGRALGYVRHLPPREQYLYTKPYIEEQIMIALGGSVAEEMYYEGRSTGSKGDFEQALHLVKSMMESGLTNLGIVDMQMITKEQFMVENQRILNELIERTRQLLEQYRNVFDKALRQLIEEEYLSGDGFRELMSVVVSQDKVSAS